MRFYQQQHRFYCGIDLHTRTMHVCIVDQTGQTRVHQNVPASPAGFLELIGPYRENLVVAAECLFTWYWLADLCQAEGIPFVLGHALYMKTIHGGKTRNDKIDSEKIARLLRGGMLPVPNHSPPSVTPRESRSSCHTGSESESQPLSSFRPRSPCALLTGEAIERFGLSLWAER